MKKQYTTPAGFIGNLVETAEELKKLNSEPINVYPSIEEILLELESEDGRADKFFESKNMPFSTWIVPKSGTLDTFKNGYQEYWQIEKTAKNSFSVEKVSLEFILATIDKKYIISFKYSFSKNIQQPEKDGQILYERETT